jgi:hypothetical protein
MENKLQEAIAALKAGDRQTGYQLLIEVLRSKPQGETAEHAWLWMSVAVDDPRKKQKSLETVLALNPNNEAARKRLAQLQQPLSSQEPTQTASQHVHKPADSAAPTKQCPFCAETIKADAKICRFCNRQLSPKGSAAVDNPRAIIQQGAEQKGIAGDVHDVGKTAAGVAFGILSAPIIAVALIVACCLGTCLFFAILGEFSSATLGPSLSGDPTRPVAIPATYTPLSPGSSQRRTLDYSGNGYDSKIVQVPRGSSMIRIAMDGNGGFTYFEVWGRGNTLLMDGACQTSYCSVSNQTRLRSNETEVEIIFNSVRQFGSRESSRWSATVTFD